MSESNIKQILAERGKTHGDFTHQAALSVHLKHRWGMALAKAHSGGAHQPGLLPFADHQYIHEGVDMIIHKLARAACGDPLVEDHWRDIAGYATLVADRVRQHHQRQATAAEQAIQQQIQKEEAQHVNRPPDRDSQPTPDGCGSTADRRDSGQTPSPGAAAGAESINQQPGTAHARARSPLSSAELDKFVRELADLGLHVAIIE